jgi:predicted DNA-binding transcriptional regulator AlpA
MMNASELLTIEEAAALAKKPVATMRWLRATGRGPRSGKLGRRVVYKRDDVIAWVESAFDADVG